MPLDRRALLIFAAYVGGLAAWPPACAEIVVYVSPAGNDAWTGTVAAAHVAYEAAALPEGSADRWRFADLFVNGQRAVRAREPDQGVFPVVDCNEEPLHGAKPAASAKERCGASRQTLTLGDDASAALAIIADPGFIAPQRAQPAFALEIEGSSTVRCLWKCR